MKTNLNQHCPICGSMTSWDRHFEVCYHCKFETNWRPAQSPGSVIREWVRTVFAVASFVIQVVALHFIVHYRPVR